MLIWLISFLSFCSFSLLDGETNPCMLSLILPANPLNLPRQNRALIRDLILMNYPPEDWRAEDDQPESPPIYDVVIIGGGMAGLSTAAALYKEGIFNIKVFDQNPNGYEGPWKSYARMKTLRSTKELMGPALDIPHLTFHAWFEAQWGEEAWREMKKIPNDLWMDYLGWYREAMQISVENECRLTSLIPMQDCLELEFEQKNGGSLIIKTRKVVLATGRNGFGGVRLPAYTKGISRSFYAHTTERIDFSKLKNQRIGILGVGASAFDAAATALENGAKSVDLLMRRQKIPNINKFVSLPYKGFSLGYYHLPDEKRWEFMCAAFSPGLPPPKESLDRLKKLKNFNLHSNTSILNVKEEGSQLLVETNQGFQSYDFLILSTGFHIDGYLQPELRHIIDQIALWKHRLPSEVVGSYPEFGHFPYLGPSFEFTSKDADSAHYLRNIYCFNYAATLSHGLLSSDIPEISIGATRLAQGIAADFFVQESDLYLEKLKTYSETEFDQEDYFP